MKTFQKLLKAIAVCLHWYTVVQSGAPFPPFAVERRRWRLAKEQMFAVYGEWNAVLMAANEEVGIPWTRLVDAEAIAFGIFSKTDGSFSVDRLNPTNKLFFSTMTDLLLAAAWTEA